MKKPHEDLPRHDWEEARARQLWPSAAFKAVGINPATIRQWAARDAISKAAIGPNGCVLYDYAEVVKYAGARVVAKPDDSRHN